MEDKLKQFEFEIEEKDIDKLLECEELIVGGTSFIKRSLFAEALAEYAAKKVAQIMAKKQHNSTEALNLHGVNDWLNFDEADPKEYNNAAANNCQLKFDDGTICRHNDDWPDAILTHFREV